MTTHETLGAPQGQPTFKQILTDTPAVRIAQLELDVAAAREDASSKVAELEQLLSDAQSEIITLNTRLSEAQRQAKEQPALADYEGKLKAQLDLSNGLMKDLEEERRLHKQAASALAGQKNDYAWLNGLFDEQAKLLEARIEEIGTLKQALEQAIKALNTQTQPPARPKIETKIFYKVADETYTAAELGADLTKLLAEGWEIEYEVHERIEVGHPSSYFARLIREVQETAHPPLEEKRTEPQPAAPIEATDWPEPQKAPDPMPKPVLEADGPWDDDTEEIVIVPLADPVEVPDLDEIEEPELEAVGQGATASPLVNYLLNQSGRSTRQTGIAMTGRKQTNMQRPRPGTAGPQYAPDAIPHRVLEDGKLMIGNVVIDPQQMPVVATMMQHGKEALINGLNLQIIEKMNAAKAAVKAQQLTLKPLPKFLGLNPGT